VYYVRQTDAANGERVVHVIGEKGHIDAAHGGFSHIRQVAPICIAMHPHLMHASLGPPVSIFQTTSRSLQPFLHISRHKVPILYNGHWAQWAAPSPPQNCLCMDASGPHLRHGSLSSPESKTQTVSRSVQRFLQGSGSRQTDRRTDHATPSVTIGSIYVCSTYYDAV